MHHRARQQVRAGGLALLDEGDGHLTELLGEGLVLGEQLHQPDRAREARGPADHDDHAKLDPLVLGIGRRADVLLRGVDGRRVVDRCDAHYEPFFALTASVSLGRILWRSPTTPRSEHSKIGAFWSLLIATMFSELCMPTLCWMAPEMPTARYSFGATVLPVWPICAAYGYQPASTTARVAATAPPSELARSSASEKFSALPSPRPPPTRMSASSMFTSAPRCSPRWMTLAFVENSESWTSTSSTSASPDPDSSISNALRRPMITPTPPSYATSTTAESWRIGRLATSLP